MIDVEVFFSLPAGPVGKTLVQSAVVAVLQKEHRKNAKVNCIFLSNSDIQSINKQYLGHDYPTDVISFLLEEDPLEAELYIGLEIARLQAQEYRVSVREEVARLAVHGALHLCGFDDTTPEAKQEMTLAEDRYLSVLRKRHLLKG